MLNKNTCKWLNQWNTGYENTYKHHAIVFNYFESGTQASDMLDMSHFHKIVMTMAVTENPQNNN